MASHFIPSLGPNTDDCKLHNSYDVQSCILAGVSVLLATVVCFYGKRNCEIRKEGTFGIKFRATTQCRATFEGVYIFSGSFGSALDVQNVRNKSRLLTLFVSSQTLVDGFKMWSCILEFSFKFAGFLVTLLQTKTFVFLK